jgi:hypothetical protein
MSGSLVSSHSRQIQSPTRCSRALSEAGTIVTPQAGQIGGRSSSTSEVWAVSCLRMRVESGRRSVEPTRADALQLDFAAVRERET